MYYSERLPVFLDYAEPSGSVGRVGGLVHACVDFEFDEPAHFVVYAGWDRDVLLCPRLVWDSWYFDRGEEVFSKMSAFLVSPCKRTVLLAHEMMD